MTSRKTGITDEINVIEESGSTDITDQLGLVQSASWDIRDPAQRGNSVGGGTTTQQFIDGLIVPTVNLSLAVPSFEALQLVGSLSSGNVTFDDTLPKHTQKFQVDDSTVLEVTGVKYGRAVVNVSRGNMVTIDFEGIGTDFAFKDTTISTSLTTDDMLTYLDATYKIDGTVVGTVDSASITYERNISAERGIEDTSSGEKRLPTEIIERIKDVSSDATIEITDDTAWKEVHDDSTLPVEPQDSRATVDVAIDLGDGGQLDLTGGKFQSEGGELAADNEIRTVDTEYQGQDASVSGIV